MMQAQGGGVQRIVRVAEVQMKQEQNRRRTFEGNAQFFPGNVPVDDLVKAGLYYAPQQQQGFTDTVKCAYCHKKIYGWTPDDDAFLEHCRLSPHCEFINNLPQFVARNEQYKYARIVRPVTVDVVDIEQRGTTYVKMKRPTSVEIKEREDTTSSDSEG